MDCDKEKCCVSTHPIVLNLCSPYMLYVMEFVSFDLVIPNQVSRLGAITSPCSPLYPVDMLAHQLVDSGSKYIATVPAAVAVVRTASFLIKL